MGDLQKSVAGNPFIDLFEYHRPPTATPETSPAHPPPAASLPQAFRPPAHHCRLPTTALRLRNPLLRTSPPPTPAPRHRRRPSTPPPPLNTVVAHRTVPSLPWIPIPHQSLLGPPSSMCEQCKYAVRMLGSPRRGVLRRPSSSSCPHALYRVHGRAVTGAVTWRGDRPLTRAVDALLGCSVRRGRVWTVTKRKHRRAREQCIPLLECSVRWGEGARCRHVHTFPVISMGGAATTGPSLSVHAAAAMLCEYSARQPGTTPSLRSASPAPLTPTHLPHRLVAIFWGTRGSPLIPTRPRRAVAEHSNSKFCCSNVRLCPGAAIRDVGGVVLDPLVSPDGGRGPPSVTGACGGGDGWR